MEMRGMAQGGGLIGMLLPNIIKYTKSWSHAPESAT
jgi:hypothetical protein